MIFNIIEENEMKTLKTRFLIALTLGALALFGVGCAPNPAAGGTETQPDGEGHISDSGMLALPELAPVELEGRPLQVVATTSLIGDVVAQVGGEAIRLTTLMGPGEDPHSYQPSAQDFAAAENADVIFLNGWGLEEALAQDLETLGSEPLLVPISAGITPLGFGEGELHDEMEGDEHSDAHESEGHDEDHHTPVDPHVWFSVPNVQKWEENVALVLRTLDPAHAEIYTQNAATYLSELQTLEVYIRAQAAQIPVENRVLVTSHDSLGYFAQAYGFEILGTVIPAASTVAEPSAADLAGLILAMRERRVCALFTETTVNATLAETVASELDHCAAVQVLPIYTGALGPAGSGAESYIGMMRVNIDTIAAGLK